MAPKAGCKCTHASSIAGMQMKTTLEAGSKTRKLCDVTEYRITTYRGRNIFQDVFSTRSYIKWICQVKEVEKLFRGWMVEMPV